MTILEKNILTMKYTSFPSFYAMTHSHPAYRPSLYTDKNIELAMLADAYDTEQERRGDPRRAYRGGRSYEKNDQ